MISIHGDESHRIRPDGIYKTGVIRATGEGYSPGPNAYAVTRSFSMSDQLRGAAGLSPWQRFKLWMRTSYAQKQAAAIYAAQAAASPQVINTDTGVPANPGASLPPSTASPGYPGQSPDATQMSAMGLYISSGFHPSFVPGVVEGRQEAAARIDPSLTSMPGALARRAEFYADGRVGQAASSGAASRFYAMNKSRIG